MKTQETKKAKERKSKQSRNLITLIGAILITGIFTFVGCSSEDEPGTEGVVGQVADSLAIALAESVVESTQIEATLAAAVGVDSGENGTANIEACIQNVGDMVSAGSIIYAVYNDGLLIHDLAAKTTQRVTTAGTVNAVALHIGQIYVGGQTLAVLNGSELEPIDLQFEGTITSLESFNEKLIVGTDAGLYSTSVFGNETLLEDVVVSSMVSDGLGVWIGTAGQGLYNWDGEDFKKRYLFRDPTLFDFVNCVDFRHNHLYVGTSDAMYIYDGGSWATLTTEDGLPSNVIRDIAVSNFVAYIATDSGVTSYFNGDFIPVKKLDTRAVNSIEIIGTKMIVGTDNEGMLMKSGSILKTIIDPENPVEEKQPNLFSISF